MSCLIGDIFTPLSSVHNRNKLKKPPKYLITPSQHSENTEDDKQYVILFILLP